MNDLEVFEERRRLHAQEAVVIGRNFQPGGLFLALCL